MFTTMPPEQKHVGKWGLGWLQTQISSIDKKKICGFISFLEISLVDCLKACDEIELWTKSTFLQTYVLLPANRRSLNIEIFYKDMQLDIYYPWHLGTHMFSSQPKGDLWKMSQVYREICFRGTLDCKHLTLWSFKHLKTI